MNKLLSSGFMSNNEDQDEVCFFNMTTELSRIWSSVLEFPYVDDYNWEQGVVLMSLTENSVGSCLLPLVNNNINDSTVAGRSNA